MANNFIYDLYDETTICKLCGNDKRLKYLLIADVKPYKIIRDIFCPGCNTHEHLSQDYSFLDYGIIVKFNSRSIDDFNDRMIFINNDAHLELFIDGKPIIDFRYEDSAVDSANSLITRIVELVDKMIVVDNENAAEYIKVREVIDEIHRTGHCEIKITDKSGFSRVCEKFKEYTGDEDLDRLMISKMVKDGVVSYEKFEKESEIVYLPEEVENKLKELGF